MSTKRTLLGIALLIIVAMAFAFAGCGSSSEGSDSQAAEEQTIGAVAEYEDYVMEILDATTEDGVIHIKVNFTNNGSDGIYGLSAFAVNAYQNGTGLKDVTDINDDGDGANLTVEVKDGASIQGEYSFQTIDDSSVEFNICAPTADEELLAEKEF